MVTDEVNGEKVVVECSERRLHILVFRYEITKRQLVNSVGDQPRTPRAP